MYVPAIEDYQKVKELAPRSTYSNASSFRIGICEAKSGQKTEAIYTLRDIIENNPRSEYRLQAYLHLGNLYRDTRDWKAASRIYKDLIRYYPNTSWAWTSTIYLAETYAHQSNIDGAIRVYQTMLRDPLVPVTLRAQAQLKIGDLYITDQRWLEAIQTYKQALRDFGKVPGVPITCEEKIKVATEGRRWGRVPYRQVKSGIRVYEAPEDENYRLKQQHEKVPYQQ
jgi:tetratricopeptide (TPR) repeat protein